MTTTLPGYHRDANPARHVTLFASFPAVPYLGWYVTRGLAVPHGRRNGAHGVQYVAARPRAARAMSGSHAGRPAPGAGPLRGRLWYRVAGATAVVAVLAGGAAALLTFSSAPATHPLAADCGLVTCGARLPPAVTGLAVHGTARAGGLHHHAHRTDHHAHRTAASKPVRSSTPAPSPSPTVTWTPDRGGGPWHHGHGDDQGDHDGGDGE
jgi:hypothetical protein